MEAMAAGDRMALFEFVDTFRLELASTVRGIVASLHRHDVARRPADIDFLVMSAALVIYDRADGWAADGALPWSWAYRPIRAEVVAWLGHPRVELLPDCHDTVRPADLTASGSDVDLRKLAEEHEPIRRWLAKLLDVPSERDRAVHTEYQIQKLLGDRSPAHTVADMFNLTPANVRQIDLRVRRRLDGRISAS